MHLQRLIVADEAAREKWLAAFQKGETACEKLGGAHLLWHGIWAFKVDATGGRTDLVYQQHLQPDASPVALGMILTEWKKAQGASETVWAAARQQTKIYSEGVLAGLELATHRYLVVVTKQQILLPPDAHEDGFVYRHINIAVDPDTPSVAARKLGG